MAAGLEIFGAAASGTNSESLSTAYASLAGDGLMTCIGTTNTNAGTAVLSVRNTFYVDTTTNSLMCKVMINGATTDAMANLGKEQPLITGVQNMTVLYGIAPTGSAQVNAYMTAPNVTLAGKWANVKAVRISLIFLNPFDSTKTITRTHTINLMN